MRYVKLVLMIPVLLFSYSAEAARISFASENCGTPPLLGLEFQVLSTGVTGGTVACPDAAVGTLVDPSGTTPLYGSLISSIELAITSPEPITSLILDDSSALLASLIFTPTAGGGLLTVLFDPAISITCGSFSTDTRLCSPRDLAIGVFDFPIGTTFLVTAVNDVRIPEPATLTLLGLGIAVAAVRRRRAGRPDHRA